MTITLTNAQIQELAAAVAEILHQPASKAPPPPPQVLTIGELASMLNVHPRTVLRKVHAGEIARVGGTGTAVRIPMSEAQRLTGQRI